METKITICIVHFNDTDFVLNSLYCLERLTKNEYQVFIIDNGSSLKNYRRLKERVGAHKNVSLQRRETNLRGSVAHGTALNILIAKVNTPYFSVLDGDAVWLHKNWDEILLSKFSDRIKVAGTQAEGKKPKDFPLMFAILFQTPTFKGLGIDFRPQDLAKAQDTGWELREKYLKAGLEGIVIEVRNTRDYKEGPFRDLIGVGEYYLKGYSHIFASHFGRGATLGAAKYRKGTPSIYHLPLLGRWLSMEKGKKEKARWIAICRKLADSQV